MIEVFPNAIIRSVIICFIGKEKILIIIMSSCSCIKILTNRCVSNSVHLLSHILAPWVCRSMYLLHPLSVIVCIYTTSIFPISLLLTVRALMACVFHLQVIWYTVQICFGTGWYCVPYVSIFPFNAFNVFMAMGFVFLST